MGGTLARGEDIRVLEWRGTRGNAGRHRDLHSHGEQRPPPAVPAQLEAPSEEEAGPLAMGPNEIPDEVPRMVVEPTEYLGRAFFSTAPACWTLQRSAKKKRRDRLPFALSSFAMLRKTLSDSARYSTVQ